jgi:hypothetical protein
VLAVCDTTCVVSWGKNIPISWLLGWVVGWLNGRLVG